MIASHSAFFADSRHNTSLVQLNMIEIFGRKRVKLDAVSTRAESGWRPLQCQNTLVRNLFMGNTRFCQRENPAIKVFSGRSTLLGRVAGAISMVPKSHGNCEGSVPIPASSNNATVT